MSKLIETIAEKAARLPPEQQREALAFIEALTDKPKTFRSVRGRLHMKLDKLDADLAEVRQEMWQNFPREAPR